MSLEQESNSIEGKYSPGVALMSDLNQLKILGECLLRAVGGQVWIPVVLLVLFL